jgi:hypothetical protein
LPYVNVLANFTLRYALVGYSLVTCFDGTEDETNYMLCRLLDSHDIDTPSYVTVRLVGRRTADKVEGSVISGPNGLREITAEESNDLIRSMACLLRKNDPVNAVEQFMMPIVCVSHVLTAKSLLTGYCLFGSKASGGKAVELIVCRLYGLVDKQARPAFFIATYEGLDEGGERKSELKLARDPAPTLKGTAYTSAKKDGKELCKALKQLLCRDKASAMGMCENPGCPPPAYLARPGPFEPSNASNASNASESRPSAGDGESGLAAPDVGVPRPDNVDIEDGAGPGH